MLCPEVRLKFRPEASLASGENYRRKTTKKSLFPTLNLFFLWHLSESRHENQNSMCTKMAHICFGVASIYSLLGTDENSEYIMDLPALRIRYYFSSSFWVKRKTWNERRRTMEEVPEQCLTLGMRREYIYGYRYMRPEASSDRFFDGSSTNSRIVRLLQTICISVSPLCFSRVNESFSISRKKFLRVLLTRYPFVRLTCLCAFCFTCTLV